MNAFKEFENSSAENPPSGISRQILARVRADLNPSPLRAFTKLAAIHFFTALATLSVCPQFGFRLVGEGMGLMHLFMRLGPHFCMVACGMFFLGASVAVAMTVLRPEEARVVRQHRWLELGALTMLSAGFFIMVLGGELVLGLFLAWALGSILGGVATLEAAVWVKNR